MMRRRRATSTSAVPTPTSANATCACAPVPLPVRTMGERGAVVVVVVATCAATTVSGAEMVTPEVSPSSVTVCEPGPIEDGNVKVCDATPLSLATGSPTVTGSDATVTFTFSPAAKPPPETLTVPPVVVDDDDIVIVVAGSTGA